MTTDDRLCLVANWTIENFGCWNGDIHDPAMTTEGSSFSRDIGLKIELYPRGLGGRGERLAVRVCSTKRPMNAEGSRGDLSFIGSDGCLLCTREMNGDEMREGVLELPPGPEFRDVVEHIRKNEDLLTLRFRFRYRETNILSNTYHMNSMVEAFETSVKVNMKSPLEGNSEAGYMMEYPLNDGRMQSMCLVVQYSDDSMLIVLSVKEGAVQRKKFAVHALTSLLSGDKDGSVLRTERNELVFHPDKKDYFWLISKDLRKEEVSRKGHVVIVNFKIIPSSTHKFLSSHISVPGKELEVTPTKISRPLQTAVKQLINSSTVLKEDLTCLYQDQDFSDITLKCDDVSFPVHRNILGARSPVFKIMLSTDMTEAASGSVDIGDLDPYTLGLLLTYLYTGEELQCDSALKLYYAADKYQVPSLKKECANFLCSQVSLSNVCDILSLAHKHQDRRLTSVAHDFILKNYNEVLASEQWGNFMKSEPLLAVETVTEFAKNKKVRGTD